MSIRDENGGSDAAMAPAKNSIAIALEHDLAKNAMPRVVASGRGRVAEQILEIAFAHGVKVREDGDLAQVLAAVDIDSVIPLEAYVAVAEILAYVYRANNGTATEPASRP